MKKTKKEDISETSYGEQELNYVDEISFEFYRVESLLLV